MSRPVEIGHYIELITDAEPGDVARRWFLLASETLPSGVRTTVQVENPNGQLANVAMVVRNDGKFRSIIPLTRDLQPAEAEFVVTTACETLEGEFDIAASDTAVADQPDNARVADLQKVDLVNLCTAWAKRDHEHWMAQKSEQGWRYGVTVSLADKTHPLMRPWEELPDQFRTIDTDRPQAMLDLMNSQGYALVRQSELDAIIRLLNGA